MATNSSFAEIMLALQQSNDLPNYGAINGSNLEADIVLDIDTTVEDLQEQIANLPLSKRQKILHSLKILSAPTKGMASVYSTFGSIAMLYQKNGLWLLAPVGLGGVIGLSDALVELLKDKYPENKWFSNSHSLLKLTNGGMVGYLADFGFTWGLIKTIAILATDNQQALKDTILIAGPMVSFLPALLLRYSRYKQLDGGAMDRGVTAFIADAMRGLTAPVGLLGTLQLQGVIAQDSYIPPAAMALGGIMMTAAYASRKRLPMASKILAGLVNLLMENPSLAAMFFAFPNDIYASVNEGYISEEFFYSNLAVSSVFLLIMTCLSLGMVLSPAKSLNNDDDEQIVEIFSDDEDDEEEDEIDPKLMEGALNLFKGEEGQSFSFKKASSMTQFPEYKDDELEIKVVPDEVEKDEYRV